MRDGKSLFSPSVLCRVARIVGGGRVEAIEAGVDVALVEAALLQKVGRV